MNKDINGFELTGEQDKGTLFLKGELGIENIGSVREALMGALAEYAELTLDLSGVESADLTFLQIVCSAHRNPAEGGGKIVGIVNRTPGFVDALARTGFDNYPAQRCGLESCLYS